MKSKRVRRMIGLLCVIAMAVGMLAAWKGCELHKLRYAGDDNVTKENLDWVNSLEGGGKYEKVMLITGEFHSPKDVEGTAWEPDEEYKDYQWWLAQDDEGSWSVVSTGY